jgi:hypothetical protein
MRATESNPQVERERRRFGMRADELRCVGRMFALAAVPRARCKGTPLTNTQHVEDGAHAA